MQHLNYKDVIGLLSEDPRFDALIKNGWKSKLDTPGLSDGLANSNSAVSYLVTRFWDYKEDDADRMVDGLIDKLSFIRLMDVLLAKIYQEYDSVLDKSKTNRAKLLIPERDSYEYRVLGKVDFSILSPNKVNIDTIVWILFPMEQKFDANSRVYYDISASEKGRVVYSNNGYILTNLQNIYNDIVSKIADLIHGS